MVCDDSGADEGELLFEPGGLGLPLLMGKHHSWNNASSNELLLPVAVGKYEELSPV